MRFKQYLIDSMDQKFAFLAVKEILTTGLDKKAKINVTKKDKTLNVKMPNTSRSTVSKGNTGMEFEVDVESK
jgi:hypothetical protein